jgi:DnaJ-class molecular chaperone
VDQVEEVAARLAGYPECDVCEGTGYVWQTNPGHEECCGPERSVCPECGGAGHMTPPAAMTDDDEVCCGREGRHG